MFFPVWHVVATWLLWRFYGPSVAFTVGGLAPLAGMTTRWFFRGRKRALRDAAVFLSLLFRRNLDKNLELASRDADALELNPEKIDIRETIGLAAQGVQDRLAESSIHLKIEASNDIGTFVADGQRIRQILFNLLSNAIGFSEPGQTIVLSASRRGEAIILKVSDQGRGIPPDVIDDVFKRFKTDSLGSRHRGVGLGLSIVRALVELHGGFVEIDSAPERGTVVSCIFPDRLKS